MVIARWRAARLNKQIAVRLIDAVTEAARRAFLYEGFAVADTVEGRFEMMALHTGLVMRRLVILGMEGRAIAQDLADATFVRFDDAMREQSISDAGVAKRQKRLGSAFYGRLKVYEAALSTGDSAGLRAALARNVYGDHLDAERHASALGGYVAETVRSLDALSLADFSAEDFKFPAPVVVEAA